MQIVKLNVPFGSGESDIKSSFTVDEASTLCSDTRQYYDLLFSTLEGINS